MKISLVIAALAASACILPTVGATAPGASGLKVVARISGPDGGWDYASFDAQRRRVYVAHGDQVLAIDADSGAMRAGFATGNHLHAVVPVPGTDRIVTTNSGDTSAKVIDAATGKVLASIPAAPDTDSAVYDPGSGLVDVIGGDSGVITLIDPRALKAVGSIKVGGALEFDQADGKGRLYVNAEDTNEIVVVDLAAGKVLRRYPLVGCRRPTGLALVAGGRLVSACGNGVVKILAAASGHDIATLKIGEGPDAVIYDARRGLAYVPSGRSGTLAVIALAGAAANTVIDTVQTQVGARTGAVDPKSGRIYLPTAQFEPAQPGKRPAAKPGTFQVLVLGR
jgi:DNA-binding beta-propeller fold protein YncE